MLGADGIKVEVYPWCTKEDDYLKKYTGNESIVNAANLATECRKWNIPLMVEVSLLDGQKQTIEILKL